MNLYIIMKLVCIYRRYLLIVLSSYAGMYVRTCLYVYVRTYVTGQGIVVERTHTRIAIELSATWPLFS
jgi:hypothetical protein